MKFKQVFKNLIQAFLLSKSDSKNDFDKLLEALNKNRKKSDKFLYLNLNEFLIFLNPNLISSHPDFNKKYKKVLKSFKPNKNIMKNDITQKGYYADWQGLQIRVDFNIPPGNILLTKELINFSQLKLDDLIKI